MYFYDLEARTEFLRTPGQRSLEPIKPETSRENVGESLSLECLSKTLDLMLQKRIVLFCTVKEYDLLLLYIFFYF
jgi:hypothetical protein